MDISRELIRIARQIQSETKNTERFDVPDILTLLKQDYLSGELTAHEVARELAAAGWTPYIKSDEEALRIIHVDDNTRIAAEQSTNEKWDVYELDVWRNENDGWEQNDRMKVFSVDVPKNASDDKFEEELNKEFKKQYGEDLNKSKWTWEWVDDGYLEIKFGENGKPTWSIIHSDD